MTSMVVLQFAKGISTREGFHTFLNPNPTLITTATVSAKGPSILMAGIK
jgi:hypothetical protein